MSSVNAPFGLRPVYHPSGVIRQERLVNGIASGYGTAIYSGQPIKPTTTGTLIATATGADNTIGIFQGVEYTSAGKFFVSPYWPASQTYDNDGLMEVYYTSDPQIIYEVQADGSVAQTKLFETANLSAIGGNTTTGLSTATISATTTGASAGTFQVVGLAGYPDNAWGDTYTIVRVKISTYSVPVA